MSRITLWTPSRLHFGLLSWGSDRSRQFGGVGLMIDSGGPTLSAEPADEWKATGRMADRVLEFASRVSERMIANGLPVRPIAFEVSSSPREHVGLGVGTQLGLAVARLIGELSGPIDLTIEQLAEFSGRGLRSGIGLHGFEKGGFIVDGGRSGPGGIPPLLVRLEFPREWWTLVVLPTNAPGLHGSREVQAFADLPPSSDALTDRLCRLILLGLIPGVVERDLCRFGDALDEIQLRVGEGFAPAQGGIYSRPEHEVVVETMRREGLVGVGQSSWGPTLYGFSDQPLEPRMRLFKRLIETLGLDPSSIGWTRASQRGATMQVDVDRRLLHNSELQ